MCQLRGGDDCCKLEMDASAISNPEAISPARDQESRGLCGCCVSADAADSTLKGCFGQRLTTWSASSLTHFSCIFWVHEGSRLEERSASLE